MGPRIGVWIAAVWMASVGVVGAQETEAVASARFPQLRATTMTIPWNEFRALLDKIEPPEREQEEKEPPAPPFEWTLSSARYDATALGNRSVRIRGTFEVLVLKREGWVEVPVAGEVVAPTSAMLDGEETSLALDDNQWFTLVIERPGVHHFEMEFYVQCVAKDGVVSFAFPCARTPLTSMTLEIPVRDAEVRSPMAGNVAVKPGKDSLIADLVFRSTDKLEVQWTLPSLVREEAVKPVIQSRVTCLTGTLTTITDRYIACESQLHYDVLRGAEDTFRVRLPKSVNVLKVTGQGAAWTRTEDEDHQILEVKVNHKVEDTYELRLNYEAPFPDEMATVKAPEFEALDVVRETGYVGICARSNIEVSPSPEIQGLTRVDVSELPTAVRAMSRSPILLAFRYADGPRLLAMDVRKLEDVEVRVASIDCASLLTMITDEGMAVTRAMYLVRNNTQRFLRVSLGETAEVWGAEVGDQVVKPARDDDSGTVLIPLLKSVETNRTLGAFPVSVTYAEPVGKAPRFLGAVNLETPSTDILANEIQWEVLLPESRHVYRTKGDLKSLDTSAQRRGKTLPPLEQPTVRRQRERIFRLREGIERFFISDINNPAATAMGQGSGERTRNVVGGPEAGAADRAETAVRVAGVLPVRVSLPTEGVSYWFKRIIVPKDESLGLTLYTYNGRLAKLAKLMLFVLGLVVGLGAGRMVNARLAGRPVQSKRLAAIAAGVAVLVVVHGTSGMPTAAYLCVALALAATVLLPRLLSREASPVAAECVDEPDGEEA